MNIAVYLINLACREDRLQSMRAQLDHLGISYERFPAIRGDDLPEWLVPYLKEADLSVGEIGCYASHLSLMRKVASGNEPALILEDDLRISPEFPTLLAELLAIAEPWDIVRLSNRSRRPTKLCHNLSHGYSLVKYVRVPIEAGAYLIHPRGASKFLNWRVGRKRPVDVDMVRVWEHSLATFGICPMPIMQNIGVSSITSMGGRATIRKYETSLGKRYDEIRRFAYNVSFMGPISALSTLPAHPRRTVSRLLNTLTSQNRY